MGFGRMDALEQLEGDLSSDSEGVEKEEEDNIAAAAAAPKPAQIDFETLQKAGYKG